MRCIIKPAYYHICLIASYPGPAQLFVAYSTEKRGEPGIFSHVSDVRTNKKLMNVGGLKLNGVIAHALVSVKIVRVCVSSLRTDLCDFRAKCTFLPTAEDREA